MREPFGSGWTSSQILRHTLHSALAATQNQRDTLELWRFLDF